MTDIIDFDQEVSDMIERYFNQVSETELDVNRGRVEVDLHVGVAMGLSIVMKEILTSKVGAEDLISTISRSIATYGMLRIHKNNSGE